MGFSERYDATLRGSGNHTGVVLTSWTSEFHNDRYLLHHVTVIVSLVLFPLCGRVAQVETSQKVHSTILSSFGSPADSLGRCAIFT